jgi:aldehyde:ferredoxin oxidoreductase
MMLGGYTGKFLRVNLTNEKTSVEKLDGKTAGKFVGGKGLGAKILYDSVNPNTDPLGPENLLIFASGPLTGTLAPSSARWVVITKSPLTGAFLDSHVGGFFGAEMKSTGFDCLVISGKAVNPTCLWIHNDSVDFINAEDLWGKGCLETETKLKERLDKNAKVASIGPAGERLVRYACITADLYRQAGRGGTGAVMGAKNLKAIAVRGDMKPEYAHPKEFREATKRAIKRIKEHYFTPIRRKYGTPAWVAPVNEAALLPTRNFSTGVFEGANNISGETMRNKIVVKDGACYNCPVACWKHTRVDSGKYRVDDLDGPEYETIALMGSNCGIDSIEKIAYTNLLCDDLGLDTISTGNVIAFIMECFEKKLISKDDVGGVELRFGNIDAQIEMVRNIAYREGLGDLLAEGVKKAAEKIGKGSERFAIHVKGMEFPGYDPRGAFGMALAYATSDRGACHQRAWTVNAEIRGHLKPRYSAKGRAKFVKDIQDERAMCFSLVLCDFMPLKVKHFMDLLNSATGFNLTEDEYLETGERIWNLTRLFNVREGMARKDDTLPARIMEEPLPEGVAKGQTITKNILDRMLNEYYALRGWDENGVPTREKLKELGLTV